MEVNDTVNLSARILFSDEYFGDYHHDVAVTNDRFGHWTVHDEPSEIDFCGPENYNAFGLLRNIQNPEGNPFITRYGGSVCGANTLSTGDWEMYDSCMNLTDLTAFHACYDFHIYRRPHIGVGGSRASYEGQTASDWPFCDFWHGDALAVVCLSTWYSHLSRT